MNNGPRCRRPSIEGEAHVGASQPTPTFISVLQMIPHDDRPVGDRFPLDLLFECRKTFDHGYRTEAGELGRDVRVRKDRLQSNVEFLDDRMRHSAGNEQPGPDGIIRARDPLFGDRGPVRGPRDALGSGDSEDAQLSGFNHAHDTGHGIEAERYLVARRRKCGRAATAIGHVRAPSPKL